MTWGTFEKGEVTQRANGRHRKKGGERKISIIVPKGFAQNPGGSGKDVVHLGDGGTGN